MDAEKFWARVQRRESGCWEYPIAVASTGYGRVLHQGKSIGAHRFSFLLTRGLVPRGRLVCHRCNNKLCVNPGHLYPGTQADNNRDWLAVQRAPGRAGVSCLD